MNAYPLLAVTALALHLVWITWIILGWLVTRNRPLLRWFHILSLVYSILIENFLWPCPLTIAEQWLQARAGTQPYQESFLIHYLEALVYPNISQTLLTWCAVGVCLFILGLYGLRFRRRLAEWELGPNKSHRLDGVSTIPPLFLAHPPARGCRVEPIVPLQWWTTG